MAAEKVTPEAISFIIRYSSGILCVAMEEERLEELNLPPMVTNNEDPKCANFVIFSAVIAVNFLAFHCLKTIWLNGAVTSSI